MPLTMHDIVRFYRDDAIIGEDRASLTTSIALLGDASVILRGDSGTGKSRIQRRATELYPSDRQVVVDMVSKLGIWSKPMVRRIASDECSLVIFPEDQNAGDAEEVVKVKKKWGDGQPAEREKSEDYGNDSSVSILPPRTFLSTAALSNEGHARTFDAESARRVIKVPTNPSAEATRAVLDAMAAELESGRDSMRVLTAMERASIRKAYALALSRTDIKAVRFLGAKALVGAVPDTFPEARSAFALFNKVLLGVARWNADREVVVDGNVFLSPSTVAETWAFYGDFLMENALKLDTGDRAILAAIPQPAYQGTAITPESCVNLKAIMTALKPAGITDPGRTKAAISRLITKGFLAEAEGTMHTTKWHRTGIADFVNFVDWKAVVARARDAAPEHLEGDALERYLAECARAAGAEAMQNPLTGEVGPLLGDKSVLYFNAATGAYTPVGGAGRPRGLFAFGSV